MPQFLIQPQNATHCSQEPSLLTVLYQINKSLSSAILFDKNPLKCYFHIYDQYSQLVSFLHVLCPKY